MIARMTQVSRRKQDGPDDNEVTKWLRVNDETDKDGNGILAHVIGKYKLFKHIASRFDEAKLQGKFSDAEAHLVGPLVDELEPCWKSGT